MNKPAGCLLQAPGIGGAFPTNPEFLAGPSHDEDRKRNRHPAA